MDSSEINDLAGYLEYAENCNVHKISVFVPIRIATLWKS